MTLLDKDLTETKLGEAFTAMGAAVKSHGVFLCFLAGHGKTAEGKYYFIPQDFRFQGDDPIRIGGIDQGRWQAWAVRVRPNKSEVIYNTCESGSLTETRSVDAAMAQLAAVERLTRAIGRTILSASTDDAPALEGHQGHGVMTFAMLDALGRYRVNAAAIAISPASTTHQPGNRLRPGFGLLRQLIRRRRAHRFGLVLI